MGLFVKIAAHEHLQQLITVELADQGARGVVIGDIGGILGKDIADDLIDGIVALVLQRGINGRQDMTDYTRHSARQTLFSLLSGSRPAEGSSRHA